MTGVGGGRAAARLLGDRLHHLSRQRIRLRPDGGDRANWPRRPNPPGSRSWSGAIRAAGKLDKAGETAIDICAYAAHMAALLGAHIIKVKPPTARARACEAAKKVYETQKIDISTLADARRACRAGVLRRPRIVVFSGGEAKDLDGVYDEVRGLRDGGANGSHHRPQHLPAPARGGAGDARHASSTSTRARRDGEREGDARRAAAGSIWSRRPRSTRPRFATRSPPRSMPAMSPAVQLRLKDVDDDAIRRAVDALRPVAQSRGVAVHA